MTEERYRKEIAILDEYYPNYSICNSASIDVSFIIRYDFYQYYIYDFEEYPNKLPKIKSTDYALVRIINKIKSNLSHYEFTISHTEVKLDIIPYHEFNPNWSILKIIRQTNEWIENVVSKIDKI